MFCPFSLHHDQNISSFISLLPLKWVQQKLLLNEKEAKINGDLYEKAHFRHFFNVNSVCFHFTGISFSESQTAEAVARLHSSLFHLLVMFSNEKSIMTVQVSEMFCKEIIFPSPGIDWVYCFSKVVSKHVAVSWWRHPDVRMFRGPSSTGASALCLARL